MTRITYSFGSDYRFNEFESDKTARAFEFILAIRGIEDYSVMTRRLVITEQGTLGYRWSLVRNCVNGVLEQTN